MNSSVSNVGETCSGIKKFFIFVLLKFQFVELIIAHSFCYINVLLQKLPKRYPSNAFLKRDRAAPPLTIWKLGAIVSLQMAEMETEPVETPREGCSC